MVSVWICEIRGRNILVPHGPFHIQHSTFSTSLPQIYTVFPVAPRLASKYAILAHFCNNLTFSHLPSVSPHATFHTPHSAPRKAIFRPSIPALSRLHLLPFEDRYLTYRTSKQAQRPIPPLPLPTQNAKKGPPALYFARNPNTRFAPKFATSNDGFRVCQTPHILSS